ncbi:MAG: transglycosylase SLT domain-containing protein [Chloroflexi bacterium]|nr:transglycosylase SLT domain-containing protein [Chloroflexota bacterium]
MASPPFVSDEIGDSHRLVAGGAAPAGTHPWLRDELTAVLATLAPLTDLDPLAPGRRWSDWDWHADATTKDATLPPIRLLLIWDNLAGHKTPAFVQWCWDRGILLLSTALGGSWLNMAESIQRFISRRAGRPASRERAGGDGLAGGHGPGLERGAHPLRLGRQAPTAPLVGAPTATRPGRLRRLQPPVPPLPSAPPATPRTCMCVTSDPLAEVVPSPSPTAPETAGRRCTIDLYLVVMSMDWPMVRTSNSRGARRLERIVIGAAVAGQIMLVMGGCLPATQLQAEQAASEQQRAAAGEGLPAHQTGQAAAADAAAQTTHRSGQTVFAATVPGATAALHHARTLLLGGDYVKAFAELAAVQAAYPGTPEAAEAMFRQAEASLTDDQFLVAADQFLRFLAAHPGHPHSAAAMLMLGRAWEGAGYGPSAIDAYRRFLDAAVEVPLGDTVYLRLADVHFAAGRVADGWAALGQAARAADQGASASAKMRAYEVLGARYLEAGNRAQAAGAFHVALDSAVAARRPAREAAALASRLVGVYQGMDRRDLADALRLRIVGEWPRTFSALQAMNDLGPDTLPALVRGEIAYANWRWVQAVEAFNWYLNNGAPEGRVDEAAHYRAVVLTRLGRNEALEALDAVADTFPSSPHAPEALWEAGSLLLRQGNRPAAAARFERLAVGYPSAEQWGQALFWLGKLLPELGNAASGRRYLEAAANAGHQGYYTFRARAALRRPSPARKPLDAQVEINADERATWEQWLAGHGLTLQAQAERRAEVDGDMRFKRGTLLLEAGLSKEAEQEFRELLTAYDGDPIAIAHVAVHVRDRGFYPFSVTLGHQLVDALERMGETSLLDAPRVVQKLVLPLAYLGLVVPAAEAKRLDPLLLLGLIKQESWFQPRAASTANARGLTQFIFETAKSVADELKWPDWKWDDMNKPYVSVPFGAHYLSSLIGEFQGNYFFALAGYNGGPGNVLRWAKGDWNRDLDLFVEDIGYAETRSYVKAVTANYELYKAIYYQ